MLKKILTLSLVAVMLSVTAFADLSAIDAYAEVNFDAAITNASQANASIDDVAGLTGSVALTIDSDVVASNAIVVTAVFDGTTFLNASITPVALEVSESNTATITLPTAKTVANDSYDVKFYLWESKATLEPLAQPYAIEVVPAQPSIAYWDGTQEEPVTEKEGNFAGYYKITNGAELAWFAKNAAAASNAYLANDIYLNEDNSTTNNWESYQIGTDTAPFTGVFDGKDNTIYNFYCTSKGTYSGMFGGCSGTIKNLKFENAQFESAATKSSSNYYSIVCAYASGGTFTNINVSGSAKTQDPSKNYMNGFGAIIGAQRGSGSTITNCVSNVSIDASSPATESSSGNLGIGGIVGMLRADGATTITGCTNNAEIYAPNSIRVGGIVGYVRTSCTIKNCTNNARITGYNYVGKIYGGKASAATITDYNTNVLNGEVVTTQ